jgi:hypothetical protein
MDYQTTPSSVGAAWKHPTCPTPLHAAPTELEQKPILAGFYRRVVPNGTAIGHRV